MEAIGKLRVTQTTHTAAQFELERAMELSQAAVNKRKEYRRQRLELQQQNIPKVVRKVQKIDPQSQQSWHTEDNALMNNRNSLRSGSNSMRTSGVGNLSINLQGVN